MMHEKTTICAPATTTGGAIAVIRVSGPKTFTILDKVFSKSLRDVKGYTLHYGQIKDTMADAVIDEVLVSVFHAPHSYTGEESAEISCHASGYIVNMIINTLVKNGCQVAQPGEFTKRAYINGKMDLSQAEAVADLIASENRASHDIAINQLKGGFASELAILREHLLKLTSLLELELDFSDHEDIEFADRTELKNLAELIDSKVISLAKSFETGQAIKKGIQVAIIGKTNVGKSTLLNQLLHEDKAIVSSTHGTTRDVIEDTTIINGYAFRFIDTAGIRATDDEVERLGIERTYQKIEQARIVIWVTDTQPTDAETSDIRSRTKGKKLICVRNKCDERPLQPILSSVDSWQYCSEDIIRISAKYGANLHMLEYAIFSAAEIPKTNGGDIIVTNARHYNILCRAHEEMLRVKEALNLEVSGDLVSEDLRQVLRTLAEITGGEVSSQDTLNNIFSHFCIGK